MERPRRVHSPVCFGLSLWVGRLVGWVGRGFDKFLWRRSSRMHLDRHSSGFPTFSLSAKSAASPSHWQQVLALRGIPTPERPCVSRAQNREDEFAAAHSKQDSRQPCSVISASSALYLTTRAHSPIWFGLSCGSGGLMVGWSRI